MVNSVVHPIASILAFCFHYVKTNIINHFNKSGLVAMKGSNSLLEVVLADGGQLSL